MSTTLRFRPLAAAPSDTRQVREALARAPVSDEVAARVEAILHRADLTARDCYDVRVALLGVRSAHDRLAHTLGLFGPAAQPELQLGERAG